ncbi:MAG: JAB domain-containing protein [Eubacteriales bacterium]|nr:JAB domain-containing protein [Eubacteriales bacterium]
MADDIHAKHRKRVLDKFRASGLNTFCDHEVLELLLFFAVPRIDTNESAHGLMRRFGSLHAVFEAPVEQLCEVKGVGLRSALLIKLVYALFGRYKADRAKTERESDKLTSYPRIGAYFVPQFSGETDEVLLAAYLDGAGRVLKCEECGRGGHAHVEIDPYKIARTALLCRAAGVALAHNHPNGVKTPSHEDIAATDTLERQLNGFGIQLVDHCVVAGDQYHSICEMRRGFGIRR